MTLRKLLISTGPVAVGFLQLALQWQYELLRRSHVNHSSVDSATFGAPKNVKNFTKSESGQEVGYPLRTSPPAAVSGPVLNEGKPPSLSSFDSGFEGAGSSQLEACRGREGVDVWSKLPVTRDSARLVSSHPQIPKDNIASLSHSEGAKEESDFGSVGNSSGASIQIIPKETVESLNFEIKVKRSVALPSNPWLSLPVDNLENSYTLTITPSPTPQRRNPQFHECSDPSENATNSNRSRDQPTQTEVFKCTKSRCSKSRDWILHSQSSLDDSELSPISNILSSTITDGRDHQKSMCTTEGVPTLLWDSYDLHEQNPGSLDR